MCFTSIGQPHIGHLLLGAPGSTLDNEASASALDAARGRHALVGADGADHVFGSIPGNAAKQPGPRRDVGECLVCSLRDGREIDGSVLDAENLFAREVTADEVEQVAVGGEAIVFLIISCRRTFPA